MTWKLPSDKEAPIAAPHHDKPSFSASFACKGE